MDISKSLPATPRSEKKNTAMFLNPIHYRVDYFGHKRHMDQNKMLVMYGVEYGLAFDDHSRFIAAFSTIPMKKQ